MTQFMKKCYNCGSRVVPATVIRDKIKLTCMKCPKCKEEFFTFNELLKYDILTGKRKMIRKFGNLGDSSIIRIPEKIIKDFKIKPGDKGFFEERPDGILIRIVKV